MGSSPGHQAAPGRGSKNAGRPKAAPNIAAQSLAQMRSGPSLPAQTGLGSSTETRVQNSCSFAQRCSGALPAMSAALIAPIEMPATQSGCRPASVSASQAPAW